MRPALTVIERDSQPRVADSIQRGARRSVASYHPGEVNRCPSCGCRQWYVGRDMAECGNKKCAAALPIVDGRQPIKLTAKPSLWQRFRGE